MEIINATTGKICACIIGPKHFLNQSIRLGEVALCIGRDGSLRTPKPFIWIIGGIEQLIDYISLARSEGEIPDELCNLLLTRLDEAGNRIPQTAITRLASIMNMEEDIKEFKEMLELAQVYISAPISGIQDFSESIPKWVPKIQSNSSTH